MTKTFIIMYIICGVIWGIYWAKEAIDNGRDKDIRKNLSKQPEFIGVNTDLLVSIVTYSVSLILLAPIWPYVLVNTMLKKLLK